MNGKASGTFEVQMQPLWQSEQTEGATLGRMSLDKKFQGELEGAGKGEMLSAVTAIPGSAGYVAIERVTASLHGRAGSFVFQHTGTMTRGAQQLSIVVVPDSGTGQLAGLAGKLAIRIEGGKHFYDFDYSLPDGQ
ncbi:DUF3224 domain-containing protein [Variovorax sp. MHTC-1]|uniref:DUF3224 domain-containing protein n=1 Tax=Variovorax sp. MHTC-1 TaxID=2495593 RepID=UPI000F8683AB|nr:DUF3224 domain-containing protein [Variovorax sp. MHTC-1]RST56650.1 DUF3224 domain-containing protein [Variovorax sp. MHTC-1]